MATARKTKAPQPAPEAAATEIAPQGGIPPTADEVQAQSLPDRTAPSGGVVRNLQRYKTAWVGGNYPAQPSRPYPAPPNAHSVNQLLFVTGRQVPSVKGRDAVIREVEAISTMHQPAHCATYKADVLDWLANAHAKE